MANNYPEFSDDHIEFNREIIKILAAHIENYPTQRFGQILFNLGISQFKDEDDPAAADYAGRDIYNDSSELVLSRAVKRAAIINKE